MKKEKELPAMPEMDSAGKLAVRLQEIDDVLDTKKEERKQTALELGEVLKMTGRTRLLWGDGGYVLKETKASTKIVRVKRTPASSRAATHASKTKKD